MVYVAASIICSVIATVIAVTNPDIYEDSKKKGVKNG